MQIRKRHKPDPRRDIAKSVLYLIDQTDDVLWWPCPEDQTIAWIREVRVALWSVQFRKYGIEDPACKV